MVKKILFLLFLTLSFIGHSQSKKTNKLAESFLKGLESRSYKKNYKQLSDTLQKIMYYSDFETIMEQVILAKGEIIGRELVRKGISEGVFGFFYKIRYKEKDSLILRLFYNKQDKVIGMRFYPANEQIGYAEPTEYGKSRFRERELSLSTPFGDLKSILTLPDNLDKNPVVILVHGSGPSDMDQTMGGSKIFYDLTLGLIDSGIGTFRYNKRTLVYGSSFSDTATLYSEVIEDVLKAVKLLKQQKGVDSTRIYVLGHSLGAMSAPLIAKYQKDLAGILMMGAPCRGLWEAFPMQYNYLKENTSQVITDKMVFDAQEMSNKIAEGDFNSNTGKNELFGLSPKYWEYIRNYSVTETCKNLTLPILILQGERDYQVNMDDYNCFRKNLGNQANIEMEVVPGSNHLFIFGREKSVPDEYNDPGNVDVKAINIIINWIKERI